MTVCLKLAQDCTDRGSRDVCHICKLLVVHIDVDGAALSRADEATISETKQNRHNALNMIAMHQVVRSSDGRVEMFEQWKGKKSPSGRVMPDDFVDRAQWEMQK